MFGGQRYLLSIAYSENAIGVFLKHSKIVLRLPADSDQEKKQAMLEAWYREILKQTAQPLIAKWASILGVTVSKLFVQRMKTKWGSCNPEAQSIRLNSELAKKIPESLEYIVVHKMMHLLESHHNDRFMALMDKHMLNWHAYRDELNRAPLGYERWTR